MKKDPLRFNKSYFADAPNKMLHSNKATDITVAYVNYCIPNMEIDLNRMVEGKLLSKYTISKGTKFIFIWKSVKSGWRYRPYLTPKKYKHKGTYWLPSTIRITKKLHGI